MLLLASPDKLRVEMRIVIKLGGEARPTGTEGTGVT
jgi:hypothetical protein